MVKASVKQILLGFIILLAIFGLSTRFFPKVTAQISNCGEFTDVPHTHPYYAAIHLLACNNIISGYSDGTFRPDNAATRGQLSKIVSESANFQEDPGAQFFDDVPTTDTFFPYINRLANRSIIAGYIGNGQTINPCTAQTEILNHHYFRPCNNMTRSQYAKVIYLAKAFSGNGGAQIFDDVPTTDTFFQYVNYLASINIVSGYIGNGQTINPCTNQVEILNHRYYRGCSNIIRGLASKVDADTFFPGYQGSITPQPGTGTPPQGTGAPTPTGTTDCSLKEQGDANCDGVVDLIDYEIWRSESIDHVTGMDADFNGDGFVNGTDYTNYWLPTYIGQAGITPTITPTPTPRTCRDVGEACTFENDCCSGLCSANGGRNGTCLPPPN